MNSRAWISQQFFAGIMHAKHLQSNLKTGAIRHMSMRIGSVRPVEFRENGALLQSQHRRIKAAQALERYIGMCEPCSDDRHRVVILQLAHVEIMAGNFLSFCGFSFALLPAKTSDGIFAYARA